MQERWDVVVRVLEGPMASRGEIVCRGPVVPLGGDPGSEGLTLRGYRGLDDRHATITSYDGQSPVITPVGTSQVRVAPHPRVDWGGIDPLPADRHLTEGCAVHLGPVDRGVTLEFVGLRELGAWQQERLASQPSNPDAPRAQAVQPHGAPPWFLGCTLLMAAMFVSVPLVVLFITERAIEPLGPRVEGQAFYEFARTDSVHPRLREGIDQPFYDFVMVHDVDASGRDELRDPAQWDAPFRDLVARSMQTHLVSWAVFRRLDAVREDYATVLQSLREAGLPDVFAAIPYRESRYRAHPQSAACARGWWQFMPETALRIHETTDLRFRVAGCRFKDADLVWKPTDHTPPRNAMRAAEYVDHSPDLDLMDPARCRIDYCAVDDRTDLGPSTAAAVYALGEPWADPELRASGALVQIAIASHHAGYDDARFGQPRPTNLRPAYLAWREDQPRQRWPHFYGASVTTSLPTEGPGDSALPAQTQHYVYSIVAAHFLAVCYYGQSYADLPAFRGYRRYTEPGGYCSTLQIPSAQAVRDRG